MIAEPELWAPTVRQYSLDDDGKPGGRLLDASVSWLNYQNEVGQWGEINLATTLSDLPGYELMTTQTPYKAYLALNGARRVYPDRNNLTQYIELPPNQFLAGKLFAPIANTLVWTSPAYDIRQTWESSRVKFDVIIKVPVPFTQIQLDVSRTGITEQTFLSFLSNLQAIDSSAPVPIQRSLNVSLTGGVLTLGFDLTGMTLPVRIDPTLDLQVGASADDVRTIDGTLSTNSAGLIAGLLSGGETVHNAARFTGVSGLSGSTIDVAYVQYDIYQNNNENLALTKLSAEDAAAPGQITTDADFTNRVLTTAKIDWDPAALFTVGAFATSPSIVTVIQELADTFDPTVIIIFHKDDGTAAADRLIASSSYDTAAAKAPKLHIEYTAAGAAGHPTMRRWGGIYSMPRTSRQRRGW